MRALIDLAKEEIRARGHGALGIALVGLLGLGLAVSAAVAVENPPTSGNVGKKFDLSDEDSIERFLAGETNIQVALVQSEISEKEAREMSNGAINGTIPQRDHVYRVDEKFKVVPMLEPYIHVPLNRFCGSYFPRFTLEHIIPPHNFYEMKFEKVNPESPRFSQDSCDEIRRYLALSDDWTPEMLAGYNMSKTDLSSLDVRFFQTSVDLSGLEGLDTDTAQMGFFSMATWKAKKIAIAELFADRRNDSTGHSSKAYFYWGENYNSDTHQVDLNVGIIDLGIPRYE